MLLAADAVRPAAPAGPVGVHLVFDDADFACLATAMRQAWRSTPTAPAADLRVLVQRSATSQLDEVLAGLEMRLPVSLETFDREEDGVRRANAAVGGLARCVWSEDITRAFRVASGFEADAVWINDWGRIACAPARSRDAP